MKYNCFLPALCLIISSSSFSVKRLYGSFKLQMCASGGTSIGDIIVKTPETIFQMMNYIAKSIYDAKSANISTVLVDFPLPVTGGTELDDWPGGIKQKYSTLYPMLVETMRTLQFAQSVIKKREYLGGECGLEDAVGIWTDKEITIVCFPTSDTLDYLKAIQQRMAQGEILVLVNQQFFLDPLSNQGSKSFLSSLSHCYLLDSLSLRGPGTLPIRGLLYRQYPNPYKAARRVDSGEYILLKTYNDKPTRAELEALFYEDSKVRDQNLSFFERLRRNVPQF